MFFSMIDTFTVTLNSITTEATFNIVRICGVCKHLACSNITALSNLVAVENGGEVFV